MCIHLPRVRYANTVVLDIVCCVIIVSGRQCLACARSDQVIHSSGLKSAIIVLKPISRRVKRFDDYQSLQRTTRNAFHSNTVFFGHECFHTINAGYNTNNIAIAHAHTDSHSRALS